jgi:hypothetical protein
MAGKKAGEAERENGAGGEPALAGRATRRLGASSTASVAPDSFTMYQLASDRQRMLQEGCCHGRRRYARSHGAMFGTNAAGAELDRMPLLPLVASE